MKWFVIAFIVGFLVGSFLQSANAELRLMPWDAERCAKSSCTVWTDEDFNRFMNIVRQRTLETCK